MTAGPGETESDLTDIPAWVNAAPGPDDGAGGAYALGDGWAHEERGATRAGHDAGHPEVLLDDEPLPLPVRRRRRHVHAASLEEWDRDQEWGHRRRRSGHWGPRLLVGLGLLIVAALVIAVGSVVWANGHLSGGGGAEVDVILPDQAGHATLASILTTDGVVSDRWLFRRYLDYRSTPPVTGGKYVFHRHEGYREALHALATPPLVVKQRMTIPEGYDLAKVAAAVGKLPGRSADRFLQLARSGAVRSRYSPPGSADLEGLLFPDTYFFLPTDDEQAILQRMVDRFDEVAAGVGLDNSATTNGLSPYQTIVAASLIEKEAKVDADRAMIARVILNRLGRRMKLQIDATVEYAEGVHKDRLLNRDLKTPSPYNTYLVTGLPPGPIGAPGKASLVGALNPTPGTWLYYVLIDPSGKHGFATTPAQFEQLRAEAKAKGLL